MNKILIDRSTVEQALEALELYVPKEDYENRPVGNVIDALRAALAEPVQEPVASAGLGPLPEPAQPAEPEGYMPGCLWPLPATPDYYTAEQMREYALRALAEEQAEPDSPERRCGGPGCDMRCCQPVLEPVVTMTVREDMGADFKFSRPHTLQPGQQFYLCATPPQRPAEPVQEPAGQLQEEAFGRGQVLWFKKPPDLSMLYTAPPQRPAEPVAYSVGRTLHWHDGKGVNDAQLYLAPPQRKPLTDEQKQAIHNETGAGHSLICLVESYINGIKE